MLLDDNMIGEADGDLLGLADGDFEGNKLGIFDGHTLGEANRDLLEMTDGDFKGSISHQDAVETLSSSCMLDELCWQDVSPMLFTVDSLGSCCPCHL